MKCSVPVPPTISVLLNEKGTEVEGKVGPYIIGATLVLTCYILGCNSLVKHSLKNIDSFTEDTGHIGASFRVCLLRLILLYSVQLNMLFIIHFGAYWVATLCLNISDIVLFNYHLCWCFANCLLINTLKPHKGRLLLLKHFIFNCIRLHYFLFLL